MTLRKKTDAFLNEVGKDKKLGKKGRVIQPPMYKGLVVVGTRMSSILSLFAGAIG